MKKYLITLLAAFSLALYAEEPAVQLSAFNGHEFSGEVFGLVETPDLDAEQTGYGFGVGYYLTQNLGARVRTHFGDLSGHTFDNVTVQGLWRVPLQGKHALYVFGGGTRAFHDETHWSFQIGPGYAWRPINHVELFTEIGMHKRITGEDRDASGIGLAGVRFTY